MTDTASDNFLKSACISIYLKQCFMLAFCTKDKKNFTKALEKSC